MHVHVSIRRLLFWYARFVLFQFVRYTGFQAAKGCQKEIESKTNLERNPSLFFNLHDLGNGNNDPN